MKTILIAAVLLLAGCSANVNQRDIEIAQASCAHNEGVKQIHTNEHYMFIACSNGASFTKERVTYKDAAK